MFFVPLFATKHGNLIDLLKNLINNILMNFIFGGIFGEFDFFSDIDNKFMDRGINTH
jgi:hypothetical protein